MTKKNVTNTNVTNEVTVREDIRRLPGPLDEKNLNQLYNLLNEKDMFIFAKKKVDDKFKDKIDEVEARISEIRENGMVDVKCKVTINWQTKTKTILRKDTRQVIEECEIEDSDKQMDITDKNEDSVTE